MAKKYMKIRGAIVVIIIIFIILGPIGSSQNKLNVMDEIHDVAVTSLKAPDVVERGDDLSIETTIRNMGTYNETNFQVTCIIKDDNENTVWTRTIDISKLNISEEKILYFTWENTTYCDCNLEIKAIVAEDGVPENNAKSKWIIVSKTLLEDDMETNENYWNHSDLTIGGEGHWQTCDSEYDKYFWCGINETTMYDNNWNDVAMINESLDFSSYTNISLVFDTHCRIAENDHGYVEISKDGGRHWEILADYTGDSNWTTITYNISMYNTNNVAVRFRFFSDESTTNKGWLIDDFSILCDNTAIFSDDFESGTKKWIIERLRVGDWWQRIDKPKDGELHNTAWWCGDELINMYPANMNNELILEDTIDLSKAFEADILFSTWHNLSMADIGYLEISNNGGAAWDLIDSFMGDSKVDNTIRWIDKSYEIDQWIGAEIKIRFRFVSDSSFEAEGWYVDDLRILGKIDNDPPITSCMLSGNMGQNDWYVSSVQVTLSATDEDGSGVDHIYYTINGGDQSIYTAPFSIDESGLHTVDYWSVDRLENAEDHKNEQFKIDVDNPEIGITQPELGIYWRGRKIWPILGLTLLTWSKSFVIRDIEIMANASDSTSGVNRVEFYIDDELEASDSSVPYSWKWTKLNLFSSHTIKTVAYDDAGNSANDEIIIRKFF
jgi:hypothetical protein